MTACCFMMNVLLSILGILTLVFHITYINGNMIQKEDALTFDFTKEDTTVGWVEVSDTKREVGMSKGIFTMQKTQVFSRAIFFTLLNPQPNGACFAGVMFVKNYNLSSSKSISLLVRGQGENKNYKIVLHHKGQDGNKFPAYEQFFTVPTDKFVEITLPFDKFKAYFRGKTVPDAEPLDTAEISSIGIQVYGGVYEDYKQKGTSSLEVDWIKSNT